MDSNNYGYLYQPPSIPRNWNADEKRFFNQLMELFDRLFSMKLGETRLKNGAVTASKIALNALDGIDLTTNQTLIPVIEYLGSENLQRALTGVTLDGRLVTVVEGIDNVTRLIQGEDGLQVLITKIQQDLSTYFDFTEDGLFIGKKGEEYHTETRPDGFYIVKGVGENRLEMVKVTVNETIIPNLRAENSLRIGKESDGYLEWYRCYGGYGLRHVSAVGGGG